MSGVDVGGEKEHALLLLRRRASNRRAVTWAHALLAGILALIYIGQINLTRFAYWQFGASQALIAITAPTWIPYLISLLVSRKVVMTQDVGLRIVWYIILITLITALVAAVLLGAFGSMGPLALILVFVCQTYLFILAGILLLAKYSLQ